GKAGTPRQTQPPARRPGASRRRSETTPPTRARPEPRAHSIIAGSMVMASPRLRVFVSSRMEELRREREAIRTALADLRVDSFVLELDAGARPIGIEQTYLEEEEHVDLYVGLFWKGYGPHTIAEFEHACRLGMDCLVYERPADAGGGRDPALQAFLDRIGD